MLRSSNPIVQNALMANANPDIVVLVGNGFDLGLGLDTDYKSFIDYYLAQGCEGNGILERFKSEIVLQKRADINSWADAELAFGKLDFSKFDNDASEALRVCVKDFLKALRDYLGKQQSRLQILEQDCASVSSSFRAALVDMIASVNEQAFPFNNDVRIGFVNFNYTNTLERILGRNSTFDVNQCNVFKRHKSSIHFGRVVHAHGALSSKMLFGVDNADQITCPIIKKLGASDGDLIKPMMAMHGDNQSYRVAKDWIRDAGFVVLFGLSYGATDASWWSELSVNMIVRKAVEVKFSCRQPNIILCPHTNRPIMIETPEDSIALRRGEILRFSKNAPLQIDVARHMRKDSFFVVPHGPRKDPSTGLDAYCDPLHLYSIGAKYVEGFARELLTKAY